MKWYRQILSDPAISNFSSASKVRYEYGARYVKGKKVLDIGFGEGQGVRLLKQKGAKQVLGIDYDHNKVKRARKNYQTKGVKYQWLEASKLDSLKSKFGVIICFELIEHLTGTEQVRFVSMIKDRLVDDGVLVLSTPNRLVRPTKRKRPDNPFHEKELSVEELKDLFQKYFSRLEFCGLSCVDEEYLKKQKELEKRWQNKLVGVLWRYRLVYKLGRFLPEKLKRMFDKTDLVKEPGVRGFNISDQKIDQQETLLLVAYK